VSLHDQLLATDEIATAFASALQTARGGEPALSPHTPGTALADPFTTAEVRGAAVPFTSESGLAGTVVVFAVPALAEAIDNAAPDGFVGNVGSALVAAASAVGSLAASAVAAQAPAAYERDALPADAPLAVYPLLDGDASVACLVVLVSAEPGDESGLTAPISSPVLDSVAGDVLGDVEMGVTAELGRTRMSVRELLSITPGAVIDLDRAAGEPVDVLVNGKLIARGEVVIVDEEFGIRISEILKQGSPH
jgi:flagellar motor switch protein FliN/FliY